MSISGRGQGASAAKKIVGKFTVGTQPVDVYLGELRTDERGNLLFLGGKGIAGGSDEQRYDDTSDGEVTAKVTITSSGATPPVLRAWVVTGPPKYAPQLDSVVTLWDRILEVVEVLPDDSLPDTDIPSYEKDVHPILQRARTMWAVNKEANGYHHTRWPDPVYGESERRKIYAWLRKPGEHDDTKMPKLNLVSLTTRQYRVMTLWRKDRFLRDWTDDSPRPDTTITPEGLDRAALDAAVGASFNPGVEVGSFVESRANWKEPYELLRLADTVAPGQLTASLYNPWQFDVPLCRDNWWPVPYPNQVRVQSDDLSPYQDWQRGIDGRDAWREYWSYAGFVVHAAKGYFETQRKEPPAATILPAADQVWANPAAEAETASFGAADVWRTPTQLALMEADLALYGRGVVDPGREHTWPLLLTETDQGVKVTVRTPVASNPRLELASPGGVRIDGTSEDVTLTRHVDGSTTMQFELPLETWRQRHERTGQWSVRIAAGDTALPYEVSAVTDSPLTARASHADGAHGVAVPSLDTTRPATSGPTTIVEGPFTTGDTAGDVVQVRTTGTSELGNPFYRTRFTTRHDG